MEIGLLKEISNPREKEEILLSLCVKAAAGEITSVNSPIEANIFRVAGSVILNNYPLEAQRLSNIATVFQNITFMQAKLFGMNGLLVIQDSETC